MRRTRATHEIVELYTMITDNSGDDREDVRRMEREGTSESEALDDETDDDIILSENSIVAKDSLMVVAKMTGCCSSGKCTEMKEKISHSPVSPVICSPLKEKKSMTEVLKTAIQNRLKEIAIICDIPVSKDAKGVEAQTEFKAVDTGTEMEPETTLSQRKVSFAKTNIPPETDAVLAASATQADAAEPAALPAKAPASTPRPSANPPADAPTPTKPPKESAQGEGPKKASITERRAPGPENQRGFVYPNQESTAMFVKMTTSTKRGQSRLQAHDEKNYGKTGRDKVIQFPDLDKAKEFVELDSTPEGPYDIWTGFMSDGQRRADYVLVLNATERGPVREAQLNYLVSLVKVGLVVEIESGVLKQHSQLQFIKLHAPDEVLFEYADAFRIRKLYMDNHIEYMHRGRGRLFYQKYSFIRVKECLQAVRKRYSEPLRLSNLDRSYLVYLLLRCQPFGDPVNFCGLQRMLSNKILVDAFALHDGPYYNPTQRKYTDFNLRQILFFYWAGWTKLFTYQPLDLINEYFGPKVAFYFAFYELYNSALAIASIWGLFMMMIYLIKSGDYLGPVVKKMKDYITESACTPQCCECVGVQRDARCPLLRVNETVFDYKFLKFFDNPYIVLYAAGMSFWAILFLVFWRRMEYYWMWLWEEGLMPMHRVLRPESKPNITGEPDKRRKKCKDRMKNAKTCIADCFSATLRKIPGHVLLPMLGLVVVIGAVIALILAYIEGIRSINVRKIDFNDTKSDPVYRLKDRKYDFFMLGTTVMVFSILLCLCEKGFQWLSLHATRLENLKTNHRFEKVVILHYFSYSFVFGMAFVVYFAWLKGLFLIAPVEITDMLLHISIPRRVIKLNISKTIKRNTILKLLSWDCPGPLSCFREAIFVYIFIIVLRTILMPIANNIWIMIWYRLPSTDRKAIPTAEREYMLRAITENDIVTDFTKLLFQFALVTMFAPLFPLAPLFAFLSNIFHIRGKAKDYIQSCRRIIVIKSRGIGYWNVILRMIVYATPLFHALTITQTMIFHLYVHYKKHNGTTKVWPPIKDLEASIKIDQYLADNLGGSKDTSYWDKKFSIKYGANAAPCKKVMIDVITSHYNVTDTISLSTQWPHAWNYLEDNRTNTYLQPEYYQIKYMKMMFVLVFANLFAIITMVMLSGGRPEYVQRRVLRERRLRRMQLTHVPPPPSEPPVSQLVT